MDDSEERMEVLLVPSGILRRLLVAAHVGAAVCVLLLDLGAVLQSLLAALILFSASCDLRSSLSATGRRRLHKLTLRSADEICLLSGKGTSVCGRVSVERLIHPLAICFCLEQENGAAIPVLVISDMCGEEAFRRLRVRLRRQHIEAQDRRARDDAGGGLTDSGVHR